MIQKEIIGKQEGIVSILNRNQNLHAQGKRSIVNRFQGMLQREIISISNLSNERESNPIEDDNRSNGREGKCPRFDPFQFRIRFKRNTGHDKPRISADFGIHTESSCPNAHCPNPRLQSRLQFNSAMQMLNLPESR
jgi:hypothetical protein